MAMKAKIVTNLDGSFYGIRFNCPGCALSRDRGTSAVVLPVHWTPPGMKQSSMPNERPHWGFNGDMDKPTFTPSILCRWEEWQGENVPNKKHVCHSFVTDGKIQFLNDCTRSLAGKTVDLPDLPEHEP
jgi:hypothetical protein